MREVGRLTLGKEGTHGTGKGRLADSFLVEGVIKYVLNGQNSDGGYTFCPGAESNAQDTYYGLEILKILNYPFPNVEKTVEWLLSIEMYNIYTYYYVGKALTLCGERLDDRFREFVASEISSRKHSISTNVYTELSSGFKSSLMVLELAEMLNLEFDGADMKRWLLGFKNRDGGFGENGHSDISSTYYAVASLCLLKHDRKNLREAVKFVRKCEAPHGGFTIIPNSLKTYIEFTYAGVMTLDLLGEKLRFPQKTADFVLKCQRANGGFARTDIGISTLESTFQAVKILQKLGAL
ncbi:MAG: prenyltransferase/squalene oxidase repeat-containing protein [Candidatus Jordarchaeaceae archaeon]